MLDEIINYVQSLQRQVEVSGFIVYIFLLLFPKLFCGIFSFHEYSIAVVIVYVLLVAFYNCFMAYCLSFFYTTSKLELLILEWKRF